jgi:iron(III) transport system permease protein
MISCLWLERPGRWRPVAVGLLFALIALPVAPLLWQTLASLEKGAVDKAFLLGLRNSIGVAVAAAMLSFVIGLPAGVLTALYQFPGRGLLLALAILPLLIPSFIWAIGWNALALSVETTDSPLFSGYGGCVFIFLAGAFTLVLLAAYAAAGMLSGSQLDAARLSGGEGTVFWQVCRSVAPAAGLAAVLAGVLTLSDPGPGLILHWRTAAAEIRTSFNYDPYSPQAGLQCALLALVTLTVTAPLVLLASPRLAAELVARQNKVFQRRPFPAGMVFTGVSLGVPVLLWTLLPILGLTLPVVRGTSLARPWGELQRTGGNTLAYAAGAAAIAALLGLALAGCAGRGPWLRRVSLGLCLSLFALPPAFGALGMVRLVAMTPDWVDPPGRLTVCLALGLRFFPVAAVLALRAWGVMPPSWAWAAGTHGVSLPTYVCRVVVPFLLPSGLVAFLLVALLATADLDTVLLLRPAGEDSFPVVIAVNEGTGREGFKAALSLLYVAVAAGLLTGLWALVRREDR